MLNMRLKKIHLYRILQKTTPSLTRPLRHQVLKNIFSFNLTPILQCKILTNVRSARFSADDPAGSDIVFYVLR
jgi:hypothetical protein